MILFYKTLFLNILLLFPRNAAFSYLSILKLYFRLNKYNLVILSFHPSLNNGTLFYGVYFQYENVNFYAIEDIILYKGKNIAFSTFTHKLSLFENILKKDIQQQPTNHPDDVIIGLPIITSIDKINNDVISSLPYKIKYIQFRNYKKQNGNQRFQLSYIDYLDLCIQEKSKVFLFVAFKLF